MNANPLVEPIKAILLQRRAALSEYELLNCLRERDAAFPADAQAGGGNLALFRRHFLIMNALYRLQETLLNDGFYLRISPLAISLEPLLAGGASVSEEVSAGLRDYYLDWNNYHATTDAGVDALLADFWQRYQDIDRRGAALRVLELDENADESAVRQAYRRLAASHHPDRGGDAARFIAIREAYELLRCR